MTTSQKKRYSLISHTIRTAVLCTLSNLCMFSGVVTFSTFSAGLFIEGPFYRGPFIRWLFIMRTFGDGGREGDYPSSTGGRRRKYTRESTKVIILLSLWPRGWFQLSPQVFLLFSSSESYHLWSWFGKFLAYCSLNTGSAKV